MSWWSDANEAEDPDKLRDDLKAIAQGAKKLGKAVRGEVRDDRGRRGNKEGRK